MIFKHKIGDRVNTSGRGWGTIVGIEWYDDLKSGHMNITRKKNDLPPTEIRQKKWGGSCECVRVAQTNSRYHGRCIQTLWAVKRKPRGQKCLNC